MSTQTEPAAGGGETEASRDPIPVLDVAVGIAVVATSTGWRLARRAGQAALPLARAVQSATAVRPGGPGAEWLGKVAQDGAEQRRQARAALSSAVDTAVSAAATETFSRLDLAQLIREYVDLEEVVAGVDAVALTQGVIEAIDLPEIIRESTGSVATETVRGARLQAVSADAAAARLVDRVLRRERALVRPPEVP